MIAVFPKRLFLTLIFCLGVNYITIAQDFFREYKIYLTGDGVLTKHRQVSIDSSIKRLSEAIAAYDKKNHTLHFLADTNCLVSFFGAETGFPSQIIWNKKGSCYYSYSYSLLHGKPTNEKLEIKGDANDILNSFTTKFRQAIATGDTAAYHLYCDKNKVFDGEFVDPVMVIKLGKHWKFIPFKGNGWAINYDDDIDADKAKERSQTVNLSSMIERYIHDSLHFNLDSAKIAYQNNPAYALTLPVIVLNNKIVDFDILKKVNINEVISISLLRGTNPKAVSYGPNSKYGVVLITTNGKKQY